MILSVTGYFNTGASAVVCYIKEFDKVKYINSEIHLLMNNSGLDELNYKMKRGNMILSGIAISKFLKLAKILSKDGIYGKPFDSPEMWNGYFFKRTCEFIDKISNGYIDNFIEFNKIEYNEQFEKVDIKLLINLKRFFYKYILRKKKSKKEFIFEKTKMYFRKDYKTYLIEQKRYLSDLVKYFDDNNTEILMFTHLLPVNILDIKDDYIEKSKIIVVDRDPRDLFILNKEKIKTNFIPNDVYDFINWYKISRERKIINENILYLNFEDLLYKYEMSSRIINEFLNLEEKNHKDKYKYLNPNISINNTQLFNKYLQYEKEIKIIEQELKEYCYNFPKIKILGNNKIF